MKMLRRLVAATAAVATTLGITALVSPPPRVQAAHHSILVFSKTAAFRHSSIDEGIAAIEALGAEHDFTVDTTEDAADFNEANLAQYAAVVWLSTTGDVLDASQQAAFEDYIRDGGGYVGIHAASDTEYAWEWYADLVGAYFLGHPPGTPTATTVTEDHAHPSTAHLDTRWSRTDEWYSFQSNPRNDVHVLQSLDETTYTPGGSLAMGHDHPLTWCHTYDGGRAWYTGAGHTEASFADDDFMTMILGGIQWAAGEVHGDCSATVWDAYQKVTLDDNTSNPMSLKVAPDGRVFYIDRNGALRIIRTDGVVVTAGTLSVSTVQEFGLLGIELDPDFATNGWIYLYYSPAGATERDVVSRFVMVGDTLDINSEVEILEVATQRSQCCHAGGDLQFDTDGNLYIATGDNTNPFASDGYAPIDERADRAAWDAQRTSANSNALNGKILRITPQDDGSYTIPDGNLFDEEADTDDLTRPEIYAMGFRNPFRVSIDPLTDKLLVADYGPDAGSANANRGPDGRVEWNIVDEPGFYGWPYCVGPNTPYIDWNFATNTANGPFACETGPVNDSPNNTGLTQLPPAIPAEQWYGQSTTGTPAIGTGGAPMAGPVYRYDPDNTSPVKWPAYWDGKAIFGEWNRTTNGMFSFQVDDDVDRAEKINVLFPGQVFRRLMDFEFGPDGALYLIEWGSGFGGNNTDSGIYRIEYTAGAQSPVAQLSATPTNGAVPLAVTFSAEGSYDPDTGPVTYAWDFDGDGVDDSTAIDDAFLYEDPGDYVARLTVTDDEGATAFASVTITAGNTPPVIDVAWPPNGGFFTFGDEVEYEVAVTDAEDGAVDCGDVVTQPALGHDVHAHGYNQYFGCSGSFPIPGDTGHIGANIFGIITFTYEDQGNAPAGSLTTQEIVQLRLRHTEAEYFDATGRLAGSTAGGTPGVQTETSTDTGGGTNIGFIEDGDWWALDPADLTNIESVAFRVASAGAGGAIEIRANSPDGPLVGSVAVPNTGGWQAWSTVSTDIEPTSTDSLYFVASSPGQDGSLFNVNWMEFDGEGVSSNRAPAIESLTATPDTGTPPLDVEFAAVAVDPDGDTELTYDWTFGDGEVATDAGPQVQHSYADQGEYTATVTVTDPQGAAAQASVPIDVSPPPLAVCFSGRSDDFLGVSLDRDRWSVIRENQELSVADSHLVLPLTTTDIYGNNNTGVPNIVVQPLPSGAVTITTKVTGQMYQAYEQGGLIIYQDDNNYVKMVFEGRTTASPNAATRVYQFAREFAGTPTETNSPAVGAGYPDTGYVQLRVDAGGIVEGFYSQDGEAWTSTGATADVSGFTNPQMGLFSLAGNGRQAGAIASFDWFLVTPDDTAGADPNDEFDGPELDLCRWSETVRHDPAAYSFGDSELVIETGNGDIYQASNSNPTNFVLQPQPGDDWTVEAKLDTSALAEQYQQGGVLAYLDDDNYVKFDMVATNAAGGTVSTNLELLNEVGGVVNTNNVNNIPRGDLWLRLHRIGDAFEGSYSLNGTDWTTVANTVTNAGVAADGSVGVFTIGTNQSAPVPIGFDYFRLLEVDTAPPAVDATLQGSFVGSFAPAMASNLAGTAEMIVTANQTTVSVGLTGLTPNAEYVGHLHTGTCAAPGGHYMHDPDGPEEPPNELWVTDLGDTTFTTDASGDATVTASAAWAARAGAQALMIHDGSNGLMRGCADLAHSTGTVTLVLAAEDDASGVVYVEYRIDAGEWSEYTAAVPISAPGAHTVEYRASDTAGNESAVGSAAFTILGDLELAVDVTPAAPDGANGWYVSPVEITATANDPSATVEFDTGSGWSVDSDGVLVVAADGEHSVSIRARRYAATTPAQQVDVAIDATAPVPGVTGISNGQHVAAGSTAAVTWSPTDATSGVAATVVTLDGAPYANASLVPGTLVPGDHVLVVTVTDEAGNSASVSVAFTVDPGEPEPEPEPEPIPEPADPTIEPLVPGRYWDTRDEPTFDGLYSNTGRVAAGTSYAIQIAGRGGVPDGATAVVANLTAILPSGAGHAAMYPCTGAVPVASHLNYGPGSVVANSATVPLSPTGELCVFSFAEAGFVLDVSGFVSGDSDVVATAPARYLETRSGPNRTTFDGLFQGQGALAAGQVFELQVAGRGDVPADAQAVLLNVTAVAPAAAGHFTLFPCTDEVPLASTLNYGAGAVVPNGAIAELSDDGALCIFTKAASDVIVDVAGYVPAGVEGLGAITPHRLLDTREGAPGRVPARGVVEIQVTGVAGVPDDARAAMLNLVAVQPDGAGYATLYPCGDRPHVSNVNYIAGAVVANNAVTKLSDSGTVCIFTLAASDLVLDVSGYMR